MTKPVIHRVSSQTLTRSGTITSAQITSTAAGDLSHVNGFVIVPAPESDVVIRLIYAVLLYEFDTAAYVGQTIVVSQYPPVSGGNLSGGVAAAQLMSASANAMQISRPVTALLLGGSGVSLRMGAAITNPGTAAGRLHWTIHYQLIPVVVGPF